ncbi:hypothetical protein IVB57_27055 [Bradyrhizobium sp. CW9]|uniref:hypothetical protein n=1 Tax=Bradyrhizobium sp. CW9 TaxID=2782689 RepID=UPI001FF9683F|nr:hypothetical protein [Bradyrhizobium sp. CW9]MCK1331964.1 hypothetical protein [Bradyrhizobium sp. CW9]
MRSRLSTFRGEGTTSLKLMTAKSASISAKLSPGPGVKIGRLGFSPSLVSDTSLLVTFQFSTLPRQGLPSFGVAICFEVTEAELGWAIRRQSILQMHLCSAVSCAPSYVRFHPRLDFVDSRVSDPVDHAGLRKIEF